MLVMCDTRVVLPNSEARLSASEMLTCDSVETRNSRVEPLFIEFEFKIGLKRCGISVKTTYL